MKRFSLITFTLLLAACGGTASSEQTRESTGVSTDTVSADAASAIGQLSAKSGAPWNATKHTLFGTTSHLEGRAPGVLVGSGYSSAIDFLAENRAIFSMRAPRAELTLTRERTDSYGMRHVRMQQVVSGIRVLHAEVMAHFDRSGALVTVDARYVPDLDKLDLTPVLSKKSALATAIADATSGAHGAIETSATEPEIVVFANGKSAPTLAYSIRVRVDGGAMPQILVYAIDAKTGAVVNKYDDLETMSTTGIGVKGDTKTLQVTQSGSGYTLVDTSRTPNKITTYTASTGQSTPGKVVGSSSASSWDTEVDAAGSAVDAHHNAGVVYDYYKTIHSRLSIDGKDGAIVSTVHFGQQYDNAFWDGTQMVYGDGDGQEFYGFAAGLDVVGHELTHGVTQNESALTYEDQSGALNESISDIMGCLVEHYSTPDPVKNWELGENIGPTPTRDMVHPSKGQQPANMSQFVNTSQDNGGVHTNSGIPNNAAYLMTMSGTNDVSNINVPFGIGYDKSQKLWYLVNTQYLSSGADFKAAAQATLSAAKAMGLTDNEQNIVQCAWIAVGVLSGKCATITDPAPPPDSNGTSDADGGDSDNTGSTGGRVPASNSGSSNDNSGSTSSNGNAGASDTAPSQSSNNGYGADRGDTAGTDSGCAVTRKSTNTPDFGSFLVLGLAIAGVVRARRKSISA